MGLEHTAYVPSFHVSVALLRVGDEDSTAVCAVPYEPVDALHPED
jgi:hypothetical protein